MADDESESWGVDTGCQVIQSGGLRCGRTDVHEHSRSVDGLPCACVDEDAATCDAILRGLDVLVLREEADIDGDRCDCDCHTPSEDDYGG